MRPLPRRTFLRGVGAAIGLPMLDAMLPAFGASKESVPPTRLMFVYAPTGAIPKYWYPESTGRNFEFPRTLKPLEPFRENVLVQSLFISRCCFIPDTKAG